MRPQKSTPLSLSSKFQSTHSLRSATGSGILSLVLFAVSIHALLAECDRFRGHRGIGRPCFNPRTPCGVRQTLEKLSHGQFTFQSTHSLRSATVRTCLSLPNICGFQSTHSLRSATIGNRPGSLVPQVSIHALLAECDIFRSPLLSDARSFNPRTPCGVRQGTCQTRPQPAGFQSTHSLRSATLVLRFKPPEPPVSIHALLAECDYRLPGRLPRTVGFNPRTPCGVRHDFSLADFLILSFQSTHSLRSATSKYTGACHEYAVSIHALLAECDHKIYSGL